MTTLICDCNQSMPLDPRSLGAALNEKLTAAQKITLNGWYGPEDIVFDSAGNMYAGVHRAEKDFKDGRILKIGNTGKTELFYDAGSWVAGLHFPFGTTLQSL